MSELDILGYLSDNLSTVLEILGTKLNISIYLYNKYNIIQYQKSSRILEDSKTHPSRIPPYPGCTWTQHQAFFAMKYWIFGFQYHHGTYSNIQYS